jgi:autotransporter-associated beta strand protein
MKTQYSPLVNPFTTTRRWFWPAVLSALMLCLTVARAQVLTWDPGHTHATNGGSDGGGDWNTTGTKSSLLTNWYSGTADVPWTDGDSVSIGANGAAGSIALKAPVIVGNITFNQTSGTTGYTLSSGTITYAAGGGTNEVDNTAGPTIYTKLVLDGTVGFTKTGNGTLVFSSLSAPTYTGQLHVAAGTLQLAGSAWNYPSSDLNVDSGATFDINAIAATVGALLGGGTVNNGHASAQTLTIGASNNGEFDGVIESTAAPADMKLVKVGTGTEILGGASTYTGSTTVSNGTLLVNGSLAASAVTVVSGASFGGFGGTVGGAVTYSSGALAVFTNGAPLNFSGALTLNGNVVHLDLPANLPQGSYTLANYAGTLTGTFNSTPVIDSGSIAGGGLASITTGGGTVTLNAQACTPAGVSQNPVNATGFTGGTATFSVVATGASPTYDWQVNTGSGFVDVSGGSGQGTPTYTTPVLAGTETGYQYQCVVSVACDVTSATSTAATLTVVNPATYHFRSAQSGNWNSPSTWQQSPDGSSWSAATSTPFSGNASILIQNGHIVTVTAPVTIDHTTIQAGGEVDVNGAALTITGASSPDCDVFGSIVVLNTAGSALVESGTPAVVFEAGSAFTSQLTTGIAIPAATWAATSTCSIAPAAAGAAVVPTGLSQTFGNFVWNWPGQTGSAILGGALTNVQGNLDITSGAGAFSFGPKPDSVATVDTLTVGGSINVHAGAGNFLLGAGGSEQGTYLVQVGKGIIVDAGGKLDMGNGGTGHVGNVTVEFTGNSQFTLNGVTMANPSSAAFIVDSGKTLTLNSGVSFGRTFTVNGTLNFNSNQLSGVTNSGALVCNGTLIGNGPGQLATGLGSVTCGGTLNINQASLTGLTSGQILTLFTAGTYSGTFPTIIPANPPGFSGWTDNLGVNGQLVVGGGGGGGGIQIASVTVSGSNLVLAGTGGTPSTAFSVIGTTDLTVARSSWSTVTTGTTDGSGNFTVTLTGAIPAGAGLEFYAIKQ